MFWLNFENDPKLGVLTKNMCIPIEKNKKTCFLFVSHDHSLTKSSKLKTICSGVVPGICVLELYTGYDDDVGAFWLVGSRIFWHDGRVHFSPAHGAYIHFAERGPFAPTPWNHAEKNPARMETA